MPEIFEHDLRTVVEFIDDIKGLGSNDLYIESGSLVVCSKNDYTVGTLVFEDDQWKLVLYEAEE